MVPPLLLLLLSSLSFATCSAQGGRNFDSSPTTAPFSDTIRTSVPWHTTQRQSTADRIEFIIGGSDEDYDEDEVSTVVNASPLTQRSCQYDMCEHLAPTCEDIRTLQGGHCLCPGIDGPEIKPDSPNLKMVLLGDHEMNVNWCSPSSTVHGYRVLYGEPGGSLIKGPALNTSFRSCTIDNLHPGSRYTVCVVAFNMAGESQVDEVHLASGGSGPCRTIQTTMRSLYLRIGLGLAAVAGLLVILSYFLWRRKRNKTKKQTNLEVKGIPNYTYKVGSIDQV